MIQPERTNSGKVLEKAPLALSLARFPGGKWLLLIVPLLYIFVLLGYSLLGIFTLSVVDERGLTLEHFARFFSEPVYLKVLWITLKTSLTVTLCTLLFAYPIAYFLAKVESQKWRQVVFAAVLIPFWISLLVRTFAWTYLLQSKGLINQILLSVGLIDEPIKLIYNSTGVMIGMTHVLLPYMVLILHSVMQGIDRNLMLAAEGLGSRPTRAFWTVFFPLSLPGVYSGSLLVFVMGIGYYITPALLGGPQNKMISQLVQTQVSEVLNWHFASAIAIVLLAVTLIFVGFSYLVMRKVPGLKGGF